MSPHSRTTTNGARARTTRAARARRSALALGAVATALLAADTAQADYSAKVQADTLTLTGDAASDRLVLQLAPGAPGTLQADVGADGTAEFSFDRSTFTAIDVAAGRGDDEVRVGNQLGAFADELVTIDGGSGDDILRGGIGAETLLGGGGNDDVAGGDGDDVARLGGGSDVFTWNPGDDSDTVEGDAGTDRMAFNGSNIGEIFDVSANGDRVRFTRNVASIVMDLDDVERIALRALGGTDVTTVNDLGGTDMEDVDVDLRLIDGSSDPQPDTVVVGGTEKRDVVRLLRSGDQVVAAGLAAQTTVTGSELLSDTLRVQTLGGDDAVAVSPAVEELITPVIDLGADE
jgi:hypothetical protein